MFSKSFKKKIFHFFCGWIQNYLSERFIKGLTSAKLQGRAQIIPDNVCEGDVVFY